MKVLITLLLSLLMVNIALSAPEGTVPKKQDQQIEFRFNPPVGLSFIATAEYTVRISQGGTESQESKGTIVSRTTISKSDKGFIFKTEPQTIILSQNEQEVKNSLAKIIQNSVVTIDADSQGKILSLKGYEDLEERLSKEFPEKQVKTLLGTVNVNSLSKQAADEWDRRLSGLVGRKLNIGQRWIEMKSEVLATGEKVVYYQMSSVKGKEKCGPKECVRIRYDYTTDRKSLELIYGSKSQALSAEDQEEAQAIAQSPNKIKGWSETVLDPNTMIIYLENLLRTINLGITTSDGVRHQSSVMEKKKYQASFIP
jgi:hypothetical protein